MTVRLCLTDHQEQLKDGQCVDPAAFAHDGRGLSAARTRAIHGLRPCRAAVLRALIFRLHESLAGR
jgi:hypothetical protein